MWNKATNRPGDWKRILGEEVKKIADSELLKGNMPVALLLFLEAGADAIVELAKTEGRRELIEEIKSKAMKVNYKDSDEITYHGLTPGDWEQING